MVRSSLSTSLRSALTRCGNACDQADRVNGIVAYAPDETKKTSTRNCSRATDAAWLWLETGGRRSTEALQFVEMLAAARARKAPRVLRRSAFLAWTRRWSRMLSVSCGRAFANSLVSPSVDLQGTVGPPPDLADLFRALCLT